MDCWANLVRARSCPSCGSNLDSGTRRCRYRDLPLPIAVCSSWTLVLMDLLASQASAVATFSTLFVSGS